MLPGVVSCCRQSIDTLSYIENYSLPINVAAALGYSTVPIGDAILETRDVTLYCQDLLSPPSQHHVLTRKGVEVFTVSSASPQSVRESTSLLRRLQDLSRHNGGVTLYSNQKGCDGDCFYYSGKATVIVNGVIAAQAPQFSLDELEVAVATVSLSELQNYRRAMDRQDGNKLGKPTYRRVNVDCVLSRIESVTADELIVGETLQSYSAEEELVFGPACWLWDMLRRSQAAGFLCPLSGGIDSCSTATLVYTMCKLVMAAINKWNKQVIQDIQRMTVQARGRMVTAYYFAQTLPTIRHRDGSGYLLVLGSVNLEECMRGNVTKHDCSSADLSVTGRMSTLDIRRIVRWAQTAFALPVLGEFLDAPPTGEFEPRNSHNIGSDEKDMGMTYEEISTMAKLRAEDCMRPIAMFERLLVDWRDEKTPRETAGLIKKFHHFYAINRHKVSTMAPAYHVADYSPYDLRPFVYPEFQGSWACKRIGTLLAEIEARGNERKDSVLQPY